VAPALRVPASLLYCPDRRRSPRHSRVEEHGILGARIRPGYDVVLVDVSAGGALIDSLHRLLPGSAIELRLAARQGRTSIRGRVLRCAVARLRLDCVWYRGAIGFEQGIPWLVDEPRFGYAVPSGETRSRQARWAGPTHVVL
jgi:hypothetical protein